MFFIGFNRKWSSPQPGQRKLAVFGSLFYTCMLVQTQLPVSFGKHMRFCFQQDVNVTAVMNTAIFSFNIVFTGAKKERKWKPPLDLNRSEVQWKQDAAVVWSGLVWFDLTRFFISVSPTDGRKWRMKLPETFVLLMWKPSSASLSLCFWLLCHFNLLTMERLFLERVKTYGFIWTFSHNAVRETTQSRGW